MASETKETLTGIALVTLGLILRFTVPGLPGAEVACYYTAAFIFGGTASKGRLKKLVERLRRSKPAITFEDVVTYALTNGGHWSMNRDYQGNTRTITITQHLPNTTPATTVKG